MDTLHVNRGAVYTEIFFDVVNGKRVKIQVPPGSKMKCNALECLLKIQAQKGVANEKVPSINSMGKNKDSDVKAIGVLINEDCRSA